MTEQSDIPLVLWVKKPYLRVSLNMSTISVLEFQFSFEDFTMFGWLSGCTAALAEGPVQQLQVHWHPSRFHSRDYCAAADKFCWRHVLLSPHTNTVDLMLWGNFRGCTFREDTKKHSASGHYQRHCLHDVQLLCSSSANLVFPRSTRCPRQRHVYADGLCSKLTARVYAVTSLTLMQSKGKNPSGLSVSSMAWVGSIWGWSCLNKLSLKRRACPASVLCKWP